MKFNINKIGLILLCLLNIKCSNISNYKYAQRNLKTAKKKEVKKEPINFLEMKHLLLDHCPDYTSKIISCYGENLDLKEIEEALDIYYNLENRNLELESHLLLTWMKKEANCFFFF